MRKDREQATVLRQSGMSYSEIQSRMSVPKSTLSAWFKGQNWSNDIAIKCASKARTAGTMRFMVLNAVRGNRLKKIYENARQDALVDFTELKYHPLFMTGIFLYWAHGDKTSSRVSFSSMDPVQVRLFKLFLLKVCSVNSVRAQLLLAGDFAHETEIKAYWSDKTGIQAHEFIKTVHLARKKQPTRPYFGVCNLIVNSAYLKSKILKWIELLADDIGQEKYMQDAGIV